MAKKVYVSPTLTQLTPKEIKRRTAKLNAEQAARFIAILKDMQVQQ